MRRVVRRSFGLVLASWMVLHCSPSRDFDFQGGDAGAGAGGVDGGAMTNPGGAPEGGDDARGNASASGGDDTGGRSSDGGAATVGGAFLGEGGAVLSEGGAASTDAGTGAGSAESEECRKESDCPAPSGDCFRRTCVEGKCGQTPKDVGALCGDAADTVCDDPDRCDGAGKCLANHVEQGTTCDDGLFCNGADACDAAGVCAHAGNVCAVNLVCDEAKGICRCALAGQQVVSYCTTPDEATDRAASSEASNKCSASGCKGVPPYTRQSTNGCQVFVCNN